MLPDGGFALFLKKGKGDNFFFLKKIKCKVQVYSLCIPVYYIVFLIRVL